MASLPPALRTILRAIGPAPGKGWSGAAAGIAVLASRKVGQSLSEIASLRPSVGWRICLRASVRASLRPILEASLRVCLASLRVCLASLRRRP